MESGVKNAIPSHEAQGRAGLFVAALAVAALLSLWPSALSVFRTWISIHDY